MSKETSTILKGVAILMMLWYHLFLGTDLHELCQPLVYIHGKALVSYLANAAYPVSFFMILSGYGLTYVYRQSRLNIKSQGKRLLKLYVHYWLILIIFVTIGSFIRPDIYPNDFLHILSNITGVYCTYNGETWFLLPYTLVSLTSVWVINYFYHLNNRKKILLTTIGYFSLFLLFRHIGNNLSGVDKGLSAILLQPVYYVMLSFYFILGIILYRLLEKVIDFSPKNYRLFTQKSMAFYALLIGFVIVKSMFKITLADGLYAFAFIWCFIHLPLPTSVNRILHELGRRSMVMWMTHTFFCVYLFPDFIYGFRYPVIIFLVLVVVCYVTSIPLMWLSKKVLMSF